MLWNKIFGMGIMLLIVVVPFLILYLEIFRRKEGEDNEY